MDSMPFVQGVNSQAAFDFFYYGLKDVVEEKIVSQAEIRHVASVFASYAKTSRYDTGSVPMLADLSEAFHWFVLQPRSRFDEELLEIAGAQSLLFVSLFRDQMRRRHNVAWWEHLGAGFYYNASSIARGPNRRSLFGGMALNFKAWARRGYILPRKLQEDKYLFRPLQ